MTIIALLFWAIRKAAFNPDNIKSPNMITEEMHETEIPIIIENNLDAYEYDSYDSAYIWTSEIIW